MTRKFELIYADRVELIELKSEYSFGVGEAKKTLKEVHPDVIKIRHIKIKEKYIK